MNRLFLVFLPFLIHCAAPLKEPALDQSKEREAIDALLTGWHDAATTGDFSAYFAAMDSISVFYGTDASENWTKQEFQSFAEPHFDKEGAWDFDVFERNIYFSERGDVAWFDELLNTWMGVCIGSGAVEKKEGKWKIKHYVLSVIVPNDDIVPVLEAKRANDSTYLVSRGVEPRIR